MSVAVQYFNEGLMIMRMLAYKNLFLDKKYFAIEPATAQIYGVVVMLPFTLKLIWGFLIDSRMVAKRKYYLVFFGILSIVTQYIIGFG